MFSYTRYWHTLLIVFFLLQQHGSVYWRVGAEQVLMSLDSTKSMAEQLAVSIFIFYTVFV